VTDRERIAEFWSWWTPGAAEIADTVDADGGRSIAAEMSERVAGLHQHLQWEFGPGEQSRHALCVTAAGVAELRPLAERWFSAAPPPDANWSYRPARVADTSVLTARLEFAGRTLDLGETRIAFAVDDERERVDVKVHNPAYRKLSDDARGQAMFLFLDWLLGEDGVERWIGEVEATKKEPRGAVPAMELVAAVEALAARAEEPHWVLIQAETPAGVTFVGARRPLKWIDHPLLDRHIDVSIAYEPRARDDSGLPEGDDMERFSRLEDELLALAGDSVVLAATETHRGTRTSTSMQTARTRPR
jgi:hypothetical protein